VRTGDIENRPAHSGCLVCPVDDIEVKMQSHAQIVKQLQELRLSGQFNAREQ